MIDWRQLLKLVPHLACYTLSSLFQFSMQIHKSLDVYLATSAFCIESLYWNKNDVFKNSHFHTAELNVDEQKNLY